MRCTMHVYDCRCTYACMELHVALYVFAWVFVCMHVCMYACMYVRTCSCVYVCLVLSCVLLSCLVVSCLVCYVHMRPCLSVCLSVCPVLSCLSACMHAGTLHCVLCPQSLLRSHKNAKYDLSQHIHRSILGSLA